MWRSKSGNPTKRFPRNLDEPYGNCVQPATGSLVVNVKGSCTQKRASSSPDIPPQPHRYKKGDRHKPAIF
jgi:hypothetical protein